MAANFTKIYWIGSLVTGQQVLFIRTFCFHNMVMEHQQLNISEEKQTHFQQFNIRQKLHRSEPFDHTTRYTVYFEKKKNHEH